MLNGITHTSLAYSRTVTRFQHVLSFAIRIVTQAFSPAHVNSAWMAVGAYPSTWADVENPQVRKGASDAGTMAMLDNNEVVAKQLYTLLEDRGLSQAVKDAGLWDWIGQHSDTWKRPDGTRQWRLREVIINDVNPKQRPSGSTGAYRRPACWHPRWQTYARAAAILIAPARTHARARSHPTDQRTASLPLPLTHSLTHSLTHAHSFTHSLTSAVSAYVYIFFGIYLDSYTFFGVNSTKILSYIITTICINMFCTLILIN